MEHKKFKAYIKQKLQEMHQNGQAFISINGYRMKIVPVAESSDNAQSDWRRNPIIYFRRKLPIMAIPDPMENGAKLYNPGALGISPAFDWWPKPVVPERNIIESSFDVNNVKAVIAKIYPDRKGNIQKNEKIVSYSKKKRRRSQMAAR